MTFLAAQDQEGFVACASMANLARLANMTIEDTEKALEILMAEDPNSTNPENEGRRVEKVPGGFLVLNGPLYRSLRDSQNQRELTRKRVAKYREIKKCNAKALPSVTGTLPRVSPTSASASASASVSKKKEKLNKETVWEELKKNPAYEGIDIEREYYKMVAWCKANGKIPSKRRFVNWLNRADKPLKISRTGIIPNPKEKDHWDSLTPQQQEELKHGK